MIEKSDFRRPEEESAYLNLTQNLVLPSPEQTISFIRHLSTDHSWYKYPGLNSEAEFVFYLDPNAGRSLLQPKDKNQPLRFIPLKDSQYRPRFGGWAYYTTGYTVNYLVKTDGTVKDSRPYIGLNIVNIEGQLVPIPEDLILAGTIPLSGYLHGGFSNNPEHLETIHRLQKHLEDLLIFYKDYLQGMSETQV